jgi:Cu-Zn family superoxide dismutase
LPGAAVFPEGIAFQQSTGDFFVSSAANGTIYRGNLRETMTQVFLPAGSVGRTAATGMKVDHEGRLFVSGAGTGQMFIYDTGTGMLIQKFDNGFANTFVNDVALDRSGNAYFTDSVQPILYRISQDASGQFVMTNWLNLTGTPIIYGPGFNLNGIAVTENDRYLIVVQSNTGQLFRISLATKEVTEINLGGTRLTNGDGLLLRGHTLYVVRNAQAIIVRVQLSGDYSTGRIVSATTDPSLAYPTTLAQADGRLLVVNSQFDKQGTGQPVLPFTVSSIKFP